MYYIQSTNYSRPPGGSYLIQAWPWHCQVLSPASKLQASFCCQVYSSTIVNAVALGNGLWSQIFREAWKSLLIFITSQSMSGKAANQNPTKSGMALSCRFVSLLCSLTTPTPDQWQTHMPSKELPMLCFICQCLINTIVFLLIFKGISIVCWEDNNCLSLVGLLQ